jgi:hypothetical protein
MTITDVTEIKVAVNAAVPPKYNLDLSGLDSASFELNAANDNLKNSEHDIRSDLSTIEQVIYAIGAAALATAVLGLITLLARVCRRLVPQSNKLVSSSVNCMGTNPPTCARFQQSYLFVLRTDGMLPPST